MGKGDKKSKKGKIAKGSYGNTRNRKAIRTRLKRRASQKPVATVEGAAKPKKTARKKSEA